MCSTRRFYTIYYNVERGEKMIDFKLTKEELQKKKELNCKKIKKLDGNMNQLDYTMLESRMPLVFLFGVIFYVLGIRGITLLPEAMNGLTMLQTGIVSALLIGSSVGVGTIAETVFYKRRNRKKGRDFSSLPKTRKQKVELKMQYEMEKEKLENQNKVIQQSLGCIEEEKRHIVALSDKYEIKDNSCENKSKNELEEMVTTTNNALIEQVKKLDKLSIRNYMISKQNDISENKDLFNIIFKGIMSGMLGMLVWIVPFMNKDLSSLFIPCSLFSTSLITTLTIYIYTAQKNRCDQEALKSINDKLGESLSLESNSLEHEYSLPHSIQKSIHIASNLLLQLQEQKSWLEVKKKEELEQETLCTKPVSTLQSTIMMEQMYPDEYLEEGPRYYKGLKAMR